MIQHQFAEKIAIIINYTLDVYIITLKNNYKKSDIDIKIKKLLSELLIKIYLSYKDYYEFQQFLVQDERSFKMKNFYILKEKLSKDDYKKNINNDKLILQFNEYLDYLEKVEKEIKDNMVNK